MWDTPGKQELQQQKIAYNGTRTDYLSLTWLALYPILQWNHFHFKHL